MINKPAANSVATKNAETAGIEQLLVVMQQLRDPDTGCPWDVQQTFASIAPYTLEEAYEVVDAIERGSSADLRDELGDLLLQVVFHAQMASEQQLFDFNDVASSIAEKMLRRHPHVFGDEYFDSAEQQTENWESIKATERSAGGADDTSALAGVALALPALLRAEKLGKRAARTGFDFPSLQSARDKLDEEILELDQEIKAPNINKQRAHEELGDVLFSVCNLARKLGINAEHSLRDANARFEQRFRGVETLAPSGFDGMSDGQLEQIWQAAKARIQADQKAATAKP